ncbi:MAG: polysaccharide biosynthesis protein [Cytophagaceae bacterium SCN 52-12]|nr:MAG: polysaccharide biosynthesis protein [Cytophagaceae bacterium SCN 52-12]
MGIIIRQSLKASFGFYLGALIGIINQMFVSTHFMSVEQLAISRLLIENAILFATFSHLGAPFIADKFFGYFRDDQEQHHGLFVFLTGLPLIGGGVFTLIYLLFTPAIKGYFSEHSPLLVNYHYLIIPFTFLWTYILVLESYCRNHSRIAIPSFIREVYFRLANVLLILMFGWGWYNFDMLLYLILAAYVMAIFELIFYISKLGKLYIKWPGRKKFSGSQVKAMLGYGAFTLLGGLGVNIILTIDRSMLAGEEGLVSAGIFIIASYIAGIIEIPKKAISQISIPYLSDALRLGNHREVRQLTQKSALHQLLVGGIFFLILWVNIDELFRFLPKGDTYAGGKYVVLLIGVVKLFDIGTGLNTEIILYSRYFRWSTVLIVSAAVASFLLNLALIPTLGYNGAALATAATTFGLSASKLGMVWSKFRMQPFTMATLKLLIVFGVLYALTLPFEATFENPVHALAMIVIKSGVLLTAFAVTVYMLNISPDANQLLKELLLKLQGNKLSKRDSE